MTKDFSKDIDNGTAVLEKEDEQTTDLAITSTGVETLPSLLDFDEKEQPLDVNLAGNYWTPEKEGESKIVIFNGVTLSEQLDRSSGELVELKTVTFWSNEGGTVCQIANSSVRLVSIFSDARISVGMKFKITYIGKKKSSSGNKYDDWKVQPFAAKN